MKTNINSKDYKYIYCDSVFPAAILGCPPTVQLGCRDGPFPRMNAATSSTKTCSSCSLPNEAVSTPPIAPAAISFASSGKSKSSSPSLKKTGVRCDPGRAAIVGVFGQASRKDTSFCL